MGLIHPQWSFGWPFLKTRSTPASASPPSETAQAADPPKPYAKLVRYQDQARSQYEPKPNETYCNLAAYEIGKAMDTPLGALGNSLGVPYTANQMAENLVGSPDWTEATPDAAQSFANQGGLGLAVSHNTKGHGHIASVRPVGVPGDHPVGLHGPVLNNIGRSNGIARQSESFGPGDHVSYYIARKRGVH